MATLKINQDHYRTLRRLAHEGGVREQFDAVTIEIVCLAVNYGDDCTVEAFGPATVLDGLPEGSFRVTVETPQGTMTGAGVMDVDRLGPYWRICF